jgi:hypothetical protein
MLKAQSAATKMVSILVQGAPGDVRFRRQSGQRQGAVFSDATFRDAVVFYQMLY